MIELLAGAALVVSGWVIGRYGRLRNTAAKAICPCTHHIGDHREMTGKCNGLVRTDIWTSSGTSAGYGYLPCTCLHYAGPELISSLTMRQITIAPTTKDEG